MRMNKRALYIIIVIILDSVLSAGALITLAKSASAYPDTTTAADSGLWGTIKESSSRLFAEIKQPQ